MYYPDTLSMLTKNEKPRLTAFLSFKKKNKTIILTTHLLAVLPKLCDNVVLINRGKIIDVIKPEIVIVKYREYVKE